MTENKTNQMRIVCTNAKERPVREDDGLQNRRDNAIWSVPVDSLVLEFRESADDVIAKYIVIQGGVCEYLLDAEGNRTCISDLDAHSYEEFVLKATVHSLVM